MEASSASEFIRVGLRRYPAARETVDHFETQVLEAIYAAFSERSRWNNFQPLRDAHSNLQIGKSTGPVDRFINSYLTGTIPSRDGGNSKVWLTLGLFWNPPRRPSAPVVAACHANVDRGGVVPFVDLPSRDQRVLLSPLYRRTERRLLVEPEEGFDLAETFSLLLDCADDALISGSSAQ